MIRKFLCFDGADYILVEYPEKVEHPIEAKLSDGAKILIIEVPSHDRNIGTVRILTKELLKKLLEKIAL